MKKVVIVFLFIFLISGFVNVDFSAGLEDMPPEVTILFPENGSSYVRSPLALKYSVFDDVAVDRCWYSLDGGLFNVTPIRKVGNFTNLVAVEGINVWTVYCNDSSGNEVSSVVEFIFDTTGPYLVGLENITIFDNESLEYPINFSDDGVGVSSYSLSPRGLFLINRNGLLINISELIVGEYSLNFRVMDFLRNTNSVAFLVKVISSDIEPPEEEHYKLEKEEKDDADEDENQDGYVTLSEVEDIKNKWLRGELNELPLHKVAKAVHRWNKKNHINF